MIFSCRTDQSIFTSVAPELFNLSIKTSWVYPALNQQATSCHSLERLVGQSQVQTPTLVVATNQISDHA